MPLSCLAPRSSFLPHQRTDPQAAHHRRTSRQPALATSEYPIFNPFFPPFTASLIYHRSLHFLCDAYGSGHPTYRPRPWPLFRTSPNPGTTKPRTAASGPIFLHLLSISPFFFSPSNNNTKWLETGLETS